MTGSVRNSCSMRVLLLVLMTLSLPAFAADDEAARLARGEAIVSVEREAGSGVPLLRLAGVIDAPPAKVWPLIDQCARYKDRLPRIAESQELSRAGDVVRCRVVVDAPWPVADIAAVTRAVHTIKPGLFMREWKLETGDYVVNEGRWVLTPFDAAGTRTLARYEVRAQPKGSMPEVLRELAQKKSLPQLLQALREHAAR